MNKGYRTAQRASFAVLTRILSFSLILLRTKFLCMLQHRAHLHLADQRKVTQVENNYRSYRTFEVAEDAASEAGVGQLLFINDDTLNIESQITTSLEPETAVVIIPVVGKVHYQSNTGSSVEAGEIAWLTSDRPSPIELSNPYATQLINFLQIGFKRSAGQAYEGVQALPLETRPNQLWPLQWGDEPVSFGSMGRFEGRRSGCYSVANPAAGVFVLVIDGVCEVEDRLMQSRDGLSLWDVPEVTFEALTAEAVILLLELGGTTKL